MFEVVTYSNSFSLFERVDEFKNLLIRGSTLVINNTLTLHRPYQQTSHKLTSLQSKEFPVENHIDIIIVRNGIYRDALWKAWNFHSTVDCTSATPCIEGLQTFMWDAQVLSIQPFLHKWEATHPSLQVKLESKRSETGYFLYFLWLILAD